MAGFTRRTYIRRYLEVPIEFSSRNHDNGQQAIVCDCCKGGMHFISEVYIEPGADILIHPCELLQTYHHDQCETGCRARVVWCHRCKDENRQGFRIGVEFTPP